METTNTISVILPIKTGKTLGFADFFDKCIQSVKYQNDHLNELIINKWKIILSGTGQSKKFKY